MVLVSLLWKVGNYFDATKNGMCIRSPIFHIGEGDNLTKWLLKVYPNGSEKEDENFVSIFLESVESDVWFAKFLFYVVEWDTLQMKKSSLPSVQMFHDQIGECGFRKLVSVSEMNQFVHPIEGVIFGCELEINLLSPWNRISNQHIGLCEMFTKNDMNHPLSSSKIVKAKMIINYKTADLGNNQPNIENFNLSYGNLKNHLFRFYKNEMYQDILTICND